MMPAALLDDPPPPAGPNDETADAVFLAVAQHLPVGSKIQSSRVRLMAAAALRAAAADTRLAERDFLVGGVPQEILKHIADALVLHS